MVTSGDDLAVNDPRLCPGYVSTLTCTGGSAAMGICGSERRWSLRRRSLQTGTGVRTVSRCLRAVRSATVDVVRSGSSDPARSVTPPTQHRRPGGGRRYSISASRMVVAVTTTMPGSPSRGTGTLNAPFVVNTNGQFANAWYSAADAQRHWLRHGGSVVFEFGSPGNTSGSWTSPMVHRTRHWRC